VQAEAIHDPAPGPLEHEVARVERRPRGTDDPPGRPTGGPCPPDRPAVGAADEELADSGRSRRPDVEVPFPRVLRHAHVAARPPEDARDAERAVATSARRRRRPASRQQRGTHHREPQPRRRLLAGPAHIRRRASDANAHDDVSSSCCTGSVGAVSAGGPGTDDYGRNRHGRQSGPPSRYAPHVQAIVAEIARLPTAAKTRTKRARATTVRSTVLVGSRVPRSCCSTSWSARPLPKPAP